jgi:hypothetical protein
MLQKLGLKVILTNENEKNCSSIFFFVSLSEGLRLPENADDAKHFYLGWEKTIEESKSKSYNDRLAIYSHAIYGFGYRLDNKFEFNDDRWIKCYKLIQKEMMTIPGHAQYIVES